MTASSHHPSPSDTGAPPRMLLLSADIGHGHDAAADALEEQVRRSWPDTRIRRADAFVAMGGGSGGFFRFWYSAGVRWLPLLHELWFHSVRHVAVVRWFYREVIGPHYPAMTLVQVTALLGDRAQVEIEATAVVPR